MPSRGWGWSLREDKCWSASRLWVRGQGDERVWDMEVREPNPAGSRRLGVIEATRGGLRIASIEDDAI